MKKNLKYNIAWVAIAAVVYGVLLALYNGGFITLFTDAIIVNIGMEHILVLSLLLAIQHMVVLLWAYS